MNEERTAVIVEGHSEIPTTPSEAPLPGPDFMSVVPEKYRETQWVKDTAKAEKPFEAFFNQFENAQKTIGEKSKALEIPGADATPEKLAEFRKALGVPETPDKYEYAPPDISQEAEPVQKILKGRLEDKTFLESMRKTAHELGITPTQFSKMATTFDGLQVNQVKALVAGQAAQIEANKTKREANIKQLYGDLAPNVIKVADDLLINKNVIPDAVRAMNDPGLALIASLNYINEKLFKNDKVNAGNLGAPPMTAQSIRSRIVELTSKPEYADWSKPGHKELKKQVDALYLEEDRMKKNKIE